MQVLAEFNFEGTTLDFWKAPNGEPVVTASSLIAALKGTRANAASIVRNNVRAKWLIEIPTPKGGRPTICLFEPGVYQLASNPMFQTELAERFQDFIFEEVLPKLRADGGYIRPTVSKTQHMTLQANLDKANPQAAWIRDAARIVELENYVESYRKKLAVLEKIACRVEADDPKKEILKYIQAWEKDFAYYHKEAQKALQGALSSARKKYAEYPRMFESDSQADIFNSLDGGKRKPPLPWAKEYAT